MSSSSVRLAAFVIAGLLALPAHALLPDLAVGATGGTLGVGAQLTTRVIPFLNLRASVQGLGFSHALDKDGVHYQGDVRLLSYGLFADFYPLTRGPRLSVGALENRNRIGLNTTCPDRCDVGNVEVSNSNGDIFGRLSFKKFAPYVGFGWTNPMAGLPLYFGFDLGVVFQGSPKPSLAATGTATLTDKASGFSRSNVDLATDPQFQAELADEQGRLGKSARNYRYYPLAQLNLGWRF